MPQITFSISTLVYVKTKALAIKGGIPAAGAATMSIGNCRRLRDAPGRGSAIFHSAGL